MTYTREINKPFDRVLVALKTLFKNQDFSVIVDIDVSEKIRNKTGNDFENYQILGVCKPDYAYRFLSHDPSLGVYLPCSLTVYQKGDNTCISGLLPKDTPLGNTGDKDLTKLAEEISQHLVQTIDAI